VAARRGAFRRGSQMELLTRAIGPLQTNVSLVGDPRTREAIVIDGAIPGLPWIVDALGRHGWRLVLIVSTHGHWDHTGENAALQAWSGQQADDGVGARIAAHRADWHQLTDPQPLFAPFPIPRACPPSSSPREALIRFGDQRLAVLHTPGHTEGSCACSPPRTESSSRRPRSSREAGAGWTSPAATRRRMVESLVRLSGLDGRCASSRATGARRRSGANGHGWTSWRRTRGFRSERCGSSALTSRAPALLERAAAPARPITVQRFRSARRAMASRSTAWCALAISLCQPATRSAASSPRATAASIAQPG